MSVCRIRFGLPQHLSNYGEQVKDVDVMLRRCLVDFKMDKMEYLVLFVGASFNCAEVVRALLADQQTANAEPNTTNHHQLALHVACKQGYVEVAELLLLDPRVSPNESHVETLGIATENGHCGIVDLLVRDERVNPGFDKELAFRFYCPAGDTQHVAELLADPELTDPSSVLTNTCHKGRTAIVELLLADPRVDASMDDNWAVQLASHT
jgi:hypothetical protein